MLSSLQVCHCSHTYTTFASEFLRLNQKEGIAYVVTVFASAFHRRCRTKIKTKLLDSAHFKQDDTSMLLNSQVSFRRPCKKVKKRHICGYDPCPLFKEIKAPS